MTSAYFKWRVMLFVLLTGFALCEVSFGQSAAATDPASSEQVQISLLSLEALYKSIRNKQSEIAAVQRGAA